METYIEINNLVVDACHGVLDFEKKEPQPFCFTCKLTLDYLNAARQDNLSLSVSYCDVMQDIADFCKNNTFNLIETLCYKTAIMLMKKYSTVSELYLNVKKPNAPYNLKFDDVGVSINLKWNTSYLSLGSNLGSKEETLHNAVSMLNSYNEINVIKESSLLRNAPYGGVATEEFVNMALKIKTLFSPLQLLNEIHTIETKLGRTRDVRWGNRTIDIDIILFENITMNTDELTIPHKDFMNRDFVLIPLREIAPYLV